MRSRGKSKRAVGHHQEQPHNQRSIPLKDDHDQRDLRVACTNLASSRNASFANPHRHSKPRVGEQRNVCDATGAPTAEHVCSTVAASGGGARDGCGAHRRFLGLERVRGRMAAVCRDAPRRPCRRAPRCIYPGVSAMWCLAWGE